MRAARFILGLFVTLVLTTVSNAQNTGQVRGQVLDETGAVISGAHITLTNGEGVKRTATANGAGEFTVSSLTPGAYTLTAEFKGFQNYVQTDLNVPTAEPLKITMVVAPIEVKTEINADNSGISVEPDQNLNAIVLDEKMIMDLLPDNEDDMLAFLQGLAGPAAGGASGGQGGADIYIDGFPGGRLPPREAILQIRINQNPFSAEYSRPGTGRIEIITKPGTEQWHASAGYNFRNSALDARNAFALTTPDLFQRRYSFTLSGPIIKKKMSFFLNGDERLVDSESIINARTLDGDFVANAPSRNENRFFGLRIGSSLTKKNFINVGFNYHESHRENNGGGFRLPETGSTSKNTHQTITFSDTYLISARLVHETRARYQHELSTSVADTPGVSINVLEAFNGGGSSCCPSSSRENQLNLQDYLTYTWKKHTIRGGLQFEYEHNSDLNASNFNGTYTFSSLDQYAQALAGAHVNPNDPTSPIVRATQFTINLGNPLLRYGQYESSLFIQDDIRLRQNLTLSAGLRYEFQSHLQDKLNLAPRVGIAWSPSKDRKTTIRTGGGIFFSRLNGNLYENTLRFNGITQQSIVIRNAIFDPDDPLGANQDAVLDKSRTIQRVLEPNLRAPYTINFTSSVEHQFPFGIFGSLTQIYARGVHFFRSRNINAPLPDTGVRPDPTQGNIYALESSASSRYNGLMFRVDRRFGRTFSLFSNYTLSWTRSDADGAQSLPANSYDLRSEWGPAFTDRRHYLFVSGSWTLPQSIRLTPFVLVSSGGPFDITTGRDDNLDTVINDRPAGIHRNSDLPASLYPLIPNRCIANCESGTPLLLRDFLETNYPNGVHAVNPGQFSVNLSVTKTFSFGGGGSRIGRAGRGQQGDSGQTEGQDQASNDGPPPGGDGPRGGRGGGGRRGGFGGGGRGGFGGRGRGQSGAEGSRYNLQVSAQITNLFNHVNFGSYGSVLGSPFFGLPSSSEPARHLEFSLRFSF